MRSATTLVVAALVAASCTSSTSTSTLLPQTVPTPVNARTLTEIYPCGWGFWLSNPDETVGLFFSPPRRRPPRNPASGLRISGLECSASGRTFLPTGAQAGSINFPGSLPLSGRLLLEPLEVLTLPEGGRGTATAVASNIVVESPDGSSRVTLGHFDLTNPRWGILAR